MTSSTSSIPFVLIGIEKIKMNDRGYLPLPEKIIYDPLSQTTNLLSMGGDTEPTTMSRVAETTGSWIGGYDSDESEDDTGKD